MGGAGNGPEWDKELARWRKAKDTLVTDVSPDKHSVKELGLRMPVYCDNKAARRSFFPLSDGNTSSKRMKHVATKIAFLREQVKEAKRVYLYHIRTQGQLADLMTKPLAASIFHPLASFMIA